MTNEAAVSETEGTFSEAEIVSDNTKMKVSILVLCKEISEKIEASVEAVVECNLVNAPVAPVFDVLDSSRISVKTESNECVLELSLYVLDKDRGVECECLDPHIVEGMDEVTNLLSHNRIKFVLIHRKGIYEVIEGDVALLTFLYVISELIESEIGDDRSGTSARETVVLELAEKACNSVLLVVLIDEIEQLVIKVTADVEGNGISVHYV